MIARCFGGAFQEMLQELREPYALGYHPESDSLMGAGALEVDAEPRRLGVRIRGG